MVYYILQQKSWINTYDMQVCRAQQNYKYKMIKQNKIKKVMSRLTSQL